MLGKVRFLPFPADDADFLTHLEAVLSGSVAPSHRDLAVIEAAQVRLRERYPAAVIRARDALAELPNDETTWYVYRDGHLTTADPGGGDRSAT
jgi:hypothetical protein